MHRHHRSANPGKAEIHVIQRFNGAVSNEGLAPLPAASPFSLLLPPMLQQPLPSPVVKLFRFLPALLWRHLTLPLLEP